MEWLHIRVPRMYVDITSNRYKYGRLKVHPVFTPSSERTAGLTRVP